MKANSFSNQIRGCEAYQELWHILLLQLVISPVFPSRLSFCPLSRPWSRPGFLFFHLTFPEVGCEKAICTRLSWHIFLFNLTRSTRKTAASCYCRMLFLPTSRWLWQVEEWVESEQLDWPQGEAFAPSPASCLTGPVTLSSHAQSQWQITPHEINSTWDHVTHETFDCLCAKSQDIDLSKIKSLPSDGPESTRKGKCMSRCLQCDRWFTRWEGISNTHRVGYTQPPMGRGLHSQGFSLV